MNSFTSGTAAQSAKVNQNFDNIRTNGLITDKSEIVRITTTDGTSTSGSTSTLDGSAGNKVYSVKITNDSSYDCYIAMGTSAVSASGGNFKLNSGMSLDLKNVKFTHFAIVRATSDDASVSIEVKGGEVEGTFDTFVHTILSTDNTSRTKTISSLDTDEFMEHLVFNRGTVDAYVTQEATATSSKILLPADRTLAFEDTRQNTVSGISSTSSIISLSIISIGVSI